MNDVKDFTLVIRSRFPPGSYSRSAANMSEVAA